MEIVPRVTKHWFKGIDHAHDIAALHNICARWLLAAPLSGSTNQICVPRRTDGYKTKTKQLVWRQNQKKGGLERSDHRLKMYGNARFVISYPPTINKSNMQANNWISLDFHNFHANPLLILPYSNQVLIELSTIQHDPMCMYIIPASRAHPSVSTTRLAPKHPQRCVGVLWKNRGAFRCQVAST